MGTDYERTKEVSLQISRNTVPLITHCEDSPWSISTLLDIYIHYDRRILWCIPGGISQQILQDLPESIWIGREYHLRWSTNLDWPLRSVKSRSNLLDQLQIGRASCRERVYIS